jgi:hypothetical protein
MERKEKGCVQCFCVFQQQWRTQRQPDTEPPLEGEPESTLFPLPSENYESSFAIFLWERNRSPAATEVRTCFARRRSGNKRKVVGENLTFIRSFQDPLDINECGNMLWLEDLCVELTFGCVLHAPWHSVSKQ